MANWQRNRSPMSVAAPSSTLDPDAAPLFAPADFAMPPGARSVWVSTPDGMRLRVVRWNPAVAPCLGTVMLLQGRNEMVEKYAEVVTDLLARGFGVVTFDWRGQGLSSRTLRDPLKGHVEHFDQYLTDLDTVLTDVMLPDCRPPYHVLAHSMGGLIALRAAPALGNRIERMVLAAPMLALADLPVSQPLLQRVFGLLSFSGLGQSMVGRPRLRTASDFPGNKLTHDRTRFERAIALGEAHPELRLGPPTVAWVFASCRAMQNVRRTGYSSAVTVPTLMIAAGGDKVVETGVIESYAQRMRAGGSVTIDGSAHEMMMERDLYRNQFWAAFDAFVPGGD
ncbi:alpha/beta hydrolase [Rhizobiaceae bacterium]|nr:alpha/beta hydrolase [Rhizobiaceae bacterium]